MFIFERERETIVSGGGAEREGDRIFSLLQQATGSELSAQSSTQGSNSQTTRS